MNSSDQKQAPVAVGSTGGSAVLDTVTGMQMEIILSEQIGATTWQVFRDMGGTVRVVIRQPTGYIETTARNIEVLLAKLVKLKIPYQPNTAAQPTAPLIRDNPNSTK